MIFRPIPMNVRIKQRMFIARHVDEHTTVAPLVILIVVADV